MKYALLFALVTVMGCGGSQPGGGTSGAQAQSHPLQGLWSGTWKAGKYHGTTEYGIAFDGDLTGNFYDETTKDRWLTVRDIENPDAPGYIKVGTDGVCSEDTYFVGNHQTLKWRVTFSQSRIVGTLETGGQTIPFEASVHRR